MAKVSREEVSNGQQQFELTYIANTAKPLYWPKVRKSS